MANKAAGKGYENENFYSDIKFQFLGIENIHVMRNSLQKLIDGRFALKVQIIEESLSFKRGHSKRRPKIGFQYQLLLNAGQKYCRMLQGEHSAILSTFIKLPFIIKIFVLAA